MKPFWIFLDGRMLPVYGRGIARNTWRGCCMMAEDLESARQVAAETFGQDYISAVEIAKPAFPVISSQLEWIRNAEVCPEPGGCQARLVRPSDEPAAYTVPKCKGAISCMMTEKGKA